MGVTGGIVLGACICYLWLKNRISDSLNLDEYELDNSVSDEDYLISDSSKNTTEIVPPYLRDIASLESKPMDASINESLHPDSNISINIVTDEKLPNPLEPQEKELNHIEVSLRPIKASNLSDEFAILGDGSMRLKRHFFSLDDWENSLRKTHLDVKSSKNVRSGLSKEAWLELRYDEDSETITASRSG